MLVISRKQTEFVQIGDDIVIKIIKTSRGAVKIGIAAPEECRVLRGELSEEEASQEETPQEETDPTELPRRYRIKAGSQLETMKPVGTLA